MTLFILVNSSSIQGELLETHEITMSKQQNFQNLSDLCIIPPDDVYDTYVENDNDLLLNVNIYNALVAKAYIWTDIGDVLRSSFIS